MTGNAGRLQTLACAPGDKTHYNIALLPVSIPGRRRCLIALYGRSSKPPHGGAAVILKWSQRRGSNPQPTAYKAAALPLSYTGTWPTARAQWSISSRPGDGQVEPGTYRNISLSRFSKYRSSLRFTRCRALSIDLTCRESCSAIS